MTNLFSLLPQDYSQLLRTEEDRKTLEFIQQKYEKAVEDHKVLHPPLALIFNAFTLTQLKDIKVVIVGQDPYHGQGQAMGLSFSVPRGHKIPPSLRNIYKELINDVGITYPDHGDLTKWAEQGVLLLNTILTVEHKKPASHKSWKWEEITNRIIEEISTNTEQVVFLLWGNYAKTKAELIDKDKHLILESAHPSPLAGNKFQGCKHFSTVNRYLHQNNKAEINWQII